MNLRSDTVYREYGTSLKVETISQPIGLINCNELYPLVNSIFRDFEIDHLDSMEWEDPQIVIRKVKKGYERSSPWLQKPVIHNDPVDAVCDLTVDLIHAFVADHPGYLCLHSAAALFKKGLILFPSTYRSGKSTLALHLAINGVPLFTDDALPISGENDGLATGLFPRIRLPLPHCVTHNFRNFIERRTVIGNDRYCYVSLDRTEQPPYGTQEQISAVILLKLDMQGNTQKVDHVQKKDAVKEIILRNFARHNKAIDIVDRIYSIAEHADCYRLTYSDPNEAAKLLKDTFS